MRLAVAGFGIILAGMFLGSRVAHPRGADPAVTLSFASASREALVRRFVAALERRDTAALDGMLMSRREFAALYYPTTPQALPPYELPEDVLWFTLEQRSRRDIGLALHELGGRPFGYLDHRCAEEPRMEGENRIWGYCAVRRRTPDGTIEDLRPFGLIIERYGRFKFVSYANRLH